MYIHTTITTVYYKAQFFPFNKVLPSKKNEDSKMG